MKENDRSPYVQDVIRMSRIEGWVHRKFFLAPVLSIRNFYNSAERLFSESSGEGSPANEGRD